MREPEPNRGILSTEVQATLWDVTRLLFATGVAQKYHRLLELSGWANPAGLSWEATHQEVPVAVVVSKDEEDRISSLGLAKIDPNTGEPIRDSKEPIAHIDAEGKAHVITPQVRDEFAFTASDLDTLLDAAKLQELVGLLIQD